MFVVFTNLTSSLCCAFVLQSELPYATWQEVQARIIEIQKEHQICIHKKELTELDIYHRILRFKNYMVWIFAMECLVAELFNTAAFKHDDIFTLYESCFPVPF